MQSLGVEGTLETALAWLGRTVGYAEGSAMAYDPDVLLPTGFATSEPRDLARSVAACRNEQLDVDVLKFRDLARGPRHVGVMGSDADPVTRTSPRWVELIRPRGHRHELRAAIVDARGRCWGAISLLREGKQGFSDRDAERVDRALPEIADRISRAMVTTSGSAPFEDMGSLWLDERGDLLFATSSATRWLDALRSEASPTRPEALLAGLAARVVARESRHESPSGAAFLLRARTSNGTWAILRGERVRAPDGESHGVAVVVGPGTAGVIFPLLVKAFGLSERELEVVRGVLNGLSTKEIAATLFLSAYTVQDHLKSVFDKVGVRSRRELAHELALRFS